MTPEIIITLIILASAVILFISEKVRPDLIALFVLLALVLTRIITPTEAISGFSSPAVIVVWAMFILSAGLARTGVAGKIGDQVLRVAGRGESRLIAVLMLAGGSISGYTGMNNIGTTALLMPVVMEVARRTRRAASKLLLPMLFGTLIGGMSLLISTPVNLLVAETLIDTPFAPLGMFSFTPAAIAFLVVSVIYMVIIGRRFLPDRKTSRELSSSRVTLQAALAADHVSLYGLEERLAVLVIPKGNPLSGKTLAESRMGTALGLNILNVERQSGEKLPPDPSVHLEAGDRLLVLGRLDRLNELIHFPPYQVVEDPVTVTKILSARIGLAEIGISSDSPFWGKTLAELTVRQKYGVNVLAVKRAEITRRTNLQNMALEVGDMLLLQGPIPNLEVFRDQPNFHRLAKDDTQRYRLEDRLLYLRIPENSSLANKSLKEARLGAAYGLAVLDIMRGGQEWLMPDPDLELQEGDLLIVEGRPLDIDVVRGLQNLTIDADAKIDLAELESGPFEFVEVVLSPYSKLVNKTLQSLDFREKFGLSVLAIWRGERAYRTDLGIMPLRYGDALLCYGPQEKFALLAREPDFIVLKTGVQEPPRRERASAALLILAGVIIAVMFNWLTISIAVLLGVVLMVVFGVLTMDEAYNAIEWKAVFLIACMLPLGIAMEATGTASYIADQMISFVGVYGPTAVLAGLFLLTLIGTQFMPNPVVAVLMAPIAITTAVNLGVQPYAFLLGVAYASTCSFLTPVAHPANVMIMSPGGYRFADYTKNGLPLAIIVFVITLIVVPLVFPF